MTCKVSCIYTAFTRYSVGKLALHTKGDNPSDITGGDIQFRTLHRENFKEKYLAFMQGRICMSTIICF